MPEFDVYFAPVGQTLYRVTARNEDKARQKAREQWLGENGEPECLDVVREPEALRT